MDQIAVCNVKGVALKNPRRIITYFAAILSFLASLPAMTVTAKFKDGCDPSKGYGSRGLGSGEGGIGHANLCPWPYMALQLV